MGTDIKIISKKFPQKGSQVVSQKVWDKMKNNGTANNFRVIDSNVTEAVKVPEEVKETLAQAKEPATKDSASEQVSAQEKVAAPENEKKVTKKETKS